MTHNGAFAEVGGIPELIVELVGVPRLVAPRTVVVDVRNPHRPALGCYSIGIESLTPLTPLARELLALRDSQ